MICSHCQTEIVDCANFCCFCGARQNLSTANCQRPPKRLTRSITDRKIAGVCGGIAEYFDIDSSVVRLSWMLVVLLPIPFVPAFLGYFVGWIIMPRAHAATVLMPQPGSTVHSADTA